MNPKRYYTEPAVSGTVSASFSLFAVPTILLQNPTDVVTLYVFDEPHSRNYRFKLFWSGAYNYFLNLLIATPEAHWPAQPT